MAFENIPIELKQFNQWVVWRFEDVSAKKPTKVPYSALNGLHASVSESISWASFDNAVAALNTGMYNGLGFVLTEKDPFALIDLDDTEGDAEQLERQKRIFNEFQSYSELSPSGNGLHILVKGSIPSGRKRSKVEIYSSGRYMTVTGNVYMKSDIKDYNNLLNVLYEQMSKGQNNAQYYTGLMPPTNTDGELFDIACKAANGEKFYNLYNGNWHNYYASQSEADFALVDIIAYYSPNRAQIVRMFRASALGQRDKALRDDYVSYMLNRCFDRMLPPVDVDGLRNILEGVLAKRRLEEKEREAEALQNVPQKETFDETQGERINSVYSVPPGLMGEIAQFIFSQAPRPIGEIALAGAMGLMSGIAGRAYNIGGAGLNQYVFLLAETGTGKEAIASGVDKLMTSVFKTVPAAVDFIGPGEISSPQAIVKYMSKGSNSFVSMIGEIGMWLQQMASINAPPHLSGLRRFMLDVYNKSGEGRTLKPTIYSDKEKNTTAITSPAFSILGESTPEKFYEGLHEGLITEGLLPRFTLIEFRGKVPPLNRSASKVKPSFELVEKLSTLCANALMLNSQNTTINVQYAPGVEAMERELEEHCRNNVNESDRDVKRQLWSRAHMKTLKLAALVAVGCNPYQPVISAQQFNWAANIILADVRNFLKRFDAGEIGTDNEETKQLAKTCEVIKDFVVKPWNECQKYAGEGASALHSNKIIPYSYIQRKLAAVAIFRKDRRGSSLAIKNALKTLCERGDLQEVSRATMAKDYQTTAVAYMIAHPSAFGL